MEVLNLKNVYNYTFERENESLQTVTLCDCIFADDLSNAYDIALSILKKINNTIPKNEHLFELVSLERYNLFCNTNEVKK